MEVFAAQFPNVPQIAGFDTAFHSTMPRVARLLPIPRRYEATGVQRYGFPGLSYAYLMQEVERVADAKAANGRVILSHLGYGGDELRHAGLAGAGNEDVRAAEAVALFCYQAKKWIGAYAAALGGLDTLVFAGASAKTPRLFAHGFAKDSAFSASN